MVAEADVNGLVEEVLQLGFGKCKLQVQVPEKTGITKAEQLVGKRIATSFEILAGRYFADLDSRAASASSASRQTTRIEYVGGSVEAACALGVADGIVDLVESGETMRAAGLHAIETLLSSQAVLIKSSKPKAENAELIRRITSRIEGVIAAGRYVLCNYNIARARVGDATSITPGRRAATVSPLDDPEWVAVSSMVLKAEVAEIMDKLQVRLVLVCFELRSRFDKGHRRFGHSHRQHQQLSGIAQCLELHNNKSARSGGLVEADLDVEDCRKRCLDVENAVAVFRL